jgi:hypothetical protein
MLDVALNEMSDHVLGALNAVDSRLLLILALIFALRLGVQMARESR